jgi:hypothetical protein
MIAWNCPLGRMVCDGCNNLTTGGCLAKNISAVFSITKEDVDRMWEERRKKLMALSKEDLVELIMGRRENF